MAYKNFDIQTTDNTKIIGYEWNASSPKAVIQIMHGMSEHMARYGHFAEFLVSKGFAVVGHDHRGHGKTAGKIERIGHLADEDGMTKLVDDSVEINKWIKEKYKEAPVFILGHSMGSFVLRKLMHDYPNVGDGVLISATGGHPGIKGTVGIKLVALIKAFGKRSRSKFMDGIAFGDFNKKYKPNRTKKDWLTRDEKVVDEYIADEYCMQTFSAQFFYDLAVITLEINKPKFIQDSNLNKPIYFFSGDMDPVGDYGEGVSKVVNEFKEHGAKDVKFKLYKDGRHEMLNELNKEEVYQDILNWLNTKVK